MVKVLICGGGNGAHVMSVILSSKKDVEATVLTVYNDEAEKWSHAMAENQNKMTVKVNQSGDQSPYYVTSRPCHVTNDVAVALCDCDVILLVVPSYAHGTFLGLLKPYIKKGTILIGCPGHAGFEYQVRHYLGNILDDIFLISLETLPWACRLTDYGKSAEILATKTTVMGAIKPAISSSKVDDPIGCLQNLLGPAPKLDMSATFLGLTLKSLNACIHPSIMCGFWKKWTGEPLEKPPLFYNGLDQHSADMLSNVSDEILQIAKEITMKHPQESLQSVKHIFEWFLATYRDDIEDKSTLYTTIRTNRAYQGLCHPCTTTPDGKYLPDFQHRYLREDIPCGLVVVKGVAEIVGVSTPVIDEIIAWAQGKLGLQFLVDGKLFGKDTKESRAPQVFGIRTLDALLSQ